MKKSSVLNSIIAKGIIFLLIFSLFSGFNFSVANPGDYTALYPNDASDDNSGWAIGGAASESAALDDPWDNPDDATTYVYCTVAGEFPIMLNVSAFPYGTVEISNITVHVRSKEVNNGPQFKFQIREGTNTNISASWIPITSTYTDYEHVFTDVGGGSPWVSNLSDLEIGIIGKDAGGGKEHFITSIYANVTYSGNVTNSNPQPTDGATDININPYLDITVNQLVGSQMNVTKRTNASGSWVDIFWLNNTGNTTMSNLTSGIFVNYNTTYWWSVNTTNGLGDWKNDTYQFTTILHPWWNYTALYPNDASDDNSGWAPYGAASEAECLDDPWDNPDDGTTEVRCGVAGEFPIMLNVSAFPYGTVEISNITVHVRLRRSIGAPALFKFQIREGANTNTTTTKTILSTWKEFEHIFTDVGGGSPWVSDLSDLEIGIIGIDNGGVHVISTHFTSIYANVTYFNSVSITNNSPASGTENITIGDTTLSVSVNHTTGKNMDVNFYSNSSGSWTLFATNTTSGNETCYQTNTNFTGNGTIYYWNVSVEEHFYINNSPIYWFRTWYAPLNPTNVDTDYVPSNLNITWTTGKYADTTVLLRNNASIPTSVTDGVLYYNGTLEYFVDDDVATQCYFRLYSYNSTRNLYSSGVNAVFGGLEVNVYNESDPTTAVTNWNLFVSNESGSEVYENLSNNNPHVVNYSSLPLGANIVVQVNATGYRNRLYYIDLRLNRYYVLNAYLTPVRNASLYLLEVLDEIDQPVADADMEIKRYLNGSYVNVTTLLTDANGLVAVFLMPYEVYKVTISKTGYQTEISDYVPTDVIFTHTFRLIAEEVEPKPPVTPTEEITFNGYIDGGILYINYTDRMEETLNSQIYIYEINISTGDETLFASHSETNNYNYQTSDTINTSNSYRVVLHYNHSEFGYQKQTLFFQGEYDTLTTQTDVDTLFELNYGTSPGGMGWSNFIMWCLLLAGCIYADNRDAGVIMVLLGAIFLFINYFIGFNTTLSTFAGGMIPVLFIVVGIIMMWNDSRKKTVGG